MIYKDTIASIATSSQNGSISIIRVSGEDSFVCVSNIFRNKSGEKIDLEKCETHTIQYGFICDEKDNQIDEVLVLLMKTPRSYTAEDVVEIHCHGGHFICQVILKLLINENVRIAEPGEFTKRAFLNGRIDLSQAESVMDVIQSKSQIALQNSLNQLKGNVKEKIVTLRKILLEDIAYLEAALDDPEHISLDEFNEKIENHISFLLEETRFLLKNSENGKMIREGIKTVIVGKPNVGKSSLLNCMLRENRAIVTNIPGTTRDTLEEDILIGKTLIHLIDTAGIHDTDNEVESIGIEKSKQSILEADFVICVLDQSGEITDEDREVLSLIENRKGVILCNKTDLTAVFDIKDIEERTKKKTIPFSAKDGVGLEELEKYLNQLFIENKVEVKENIYITNIRQRQALVEAEKSLEQVQESITIGMPEDMYAIDLTDAYTALGKIIGETVEEDIIDKIFKDFCMGK